MLNFDSLYNPSSSKRMTVFGSRGMVAASQPLASQAGLDILKQGGNAIDAAIATAAALTVVEPTSNGIGGDAFAIVWVKGELHGLNASGPSPKSISIEEVKKLGYEEMPQHGMIPVTVPGAPSAWAALSERFGKLSLKETLQPAIEYAEKGYPISPVISQLWEEAYATYSKEEGEEFKHWFEAFAPEGRSPKPGEIWNSPHHASTLRSIAETNAESFYRGELAEKIDQFSRQNGGFIRKEDLNSYSPEWVNPINVNYRGYDVWEIPPNGSGMIALMALNILNGFEIGEGGSVDAYHKQVEAMKLAYVDGFKYITEKDKMGVSVKQLLSESYAEVRRSLITEEAMFPEPGDPLAGGTVYLAAADEDGNMISYIQSNFKGFGSGMVVPETGISLQNRGLSFKLEDDHYNCLEPGKKTYHTIIPGFLTKDGQPVGPFGVMGGFMQPQGHVQVIMNMIDFHLNPQAALDAPRWKWVNGKTVEVEPHFPDHIAQALVRKGHQIVKRVDSLSFGRGQIIVRNPKTGVLSGGSESRTDGTVLGW
ncbi:gamma-glutamyltransferase family protein [Bacillus sp. ISL-47]|uniref:gamma-glutamyltransferase family protein n=1 Tax=Bacillus sp. ISL-47 TaxID=2819130 RepID=UPI001BE8FC82|nr:gamma-glutamyltransferase family protein [Bacillus sp. ISL-47]MBT2689098.1 gamma-glutamyltransferase family protein [Bacillus sp. ISL-47]MBT2708554.1 gamma-glutamyltransferase family protein [Pseudomonas sp. ISL-84]